MESATQELYHQRIKEFVYDEEKIVTVVSLASELNISCKDSQKLLDVFVEDHQSLKQSSKFEDLHVTYLLHGILQDGKGVCVYLVTEEDFNDKKCLFSEISTKIIFSIQKSKDINFNAIALTNSQCKKSLGLLASKNCIKRNFKPKKLPITQGTSERSASSTNGDVKVNVPEKQKTALSSQKQQSKIKQGRIGNFFNKTATKTENVKVEANDKIITSDAKKEEKAFEQLPLNHETNSKTQVNKEEISNTSKIFEKMVVDSEEENKSEAKPNEEKNNKKRKKSIKNKSSNKKRKRIQQICDSDSSDIFDDDENDVIEMSDEEKVSILDPKPISAPKKKVRKAVDKTYVDEEGFIVTTTEYIYETTSDNEDKEPDKSKENDKMPSNIGNIEPPKAKSSEKSLSEKKKEKPTSEVKSQVKKGKTSGKQKAANQPTLMNFFKKC